MKNFIIYDSYFGNTEKIAKIIGEMINAETIHVNKATINELKNIDLLVIGSPTRAFRPTDKIKRFLNEIPANGLNGVKVAAFDSGIRSEDSPKFLRLMIRWFGYAAKPILNSLVKKGGKQIAPPIGFYVKDVKGPLLDGETTRAKEWAEQINTSLI